MRSVLCLLTVAALVAAAACAGVKVPAEQAVAAADTALAGVAGEAAKYVPDELKNAQDLLSSAKASVERGEYQAALTTAQEIPGKVSALQAAIAAKKEELTKAWESLGGTSQALDAIKAQVTALTGARRLPAGVTAAGVARAKDGLAALSQTWAEATAAAQGGDLAAAVAKASAVKDQVATVMASLHMPPAAETK